MQVYATTLAQNLNAMTLSSPIIFADREATTTCACGGESRCTIRSLKQRDGKLSSPSIMDSNTEISRVAIVVIGPDRLQLGRLFLLVGG